MKNQKSPTSCYCLKMRRASADVTKFYDRMLETSGVSVGQFSILLNISKSEKGSVKELADMAELDRSTLARSIKPLINRKLVYDGKDEGARDSKLMLTEEGKNVLEQAKALWEEAQTKMRDNLKGHGITELDKMLRALEML
ncbi:MAG: MarR family winged helix-turn-helix transcriptional regulator [Clostridiaceae bacterium]